MTPDEIQEKNKKIQHEAWLNVEKLSCRKIAIQCAQSTDHANITSTLLENAEEIYLWLIKELQ